MKYNKKFKTFEEQIEQLSDRGIVFNKISKKEAELKINHINYYKLSAYIKFFEKSCDQFENTDFIEVLDL